MYIAILLIAIGISSCILVKYFWGEDEFEKEHKEATSFRSSENEADSNR